MFTKYFHFKLWNWNKCKVKAAKESDKLQTIFNVISRDMTKRYLNAMKNTLYKYLYVCNIFKLTLSEFYVMIYFTIW